MKRRPLVLAATTIASAALVFTVMVTFAGAQDDDAPDASSEDAPTPLATCLAAQAGVAEAATAEGLGGRTFGVFDHGTRTWVEIEPQAYCEASLAVQPDFSDEELTKANLGTVQVFRSGEFVIDYVERTVVVEGDITVGTTTSDVVPYEEVVSRVEVVRASGG